MVWSPHLFKDIDTSNTKPPNIVPSIIGLPYEMTLKILNLHNLIYAQHLRSDSIETYVQDFKWIY